MARYRLVYANRQIVTSDVNDINENFKINNEIILRDILGVTSGVVTGNNATFSGLNLTISSGKISDGSNFRELFTNTVLELPSTDQTYKIYLTLNQKSDMPKSGFILLDTATRNQEFNVVNTRTYDSYDVDYGITQPSNTILIGEVVVSGGEITTYTDLKQYVEFGNLAVNSLQAFSEIGRSSVARTNKVTGVIIDESTPTSVSWLSIGINNAHAGRGIKIDAGNNVNAVGISLGVNNNIGIDQIISSNGIGFKANLNENTNGFSAIGGSLTNTIGYKANTLAKGIQLNNNTIGVEVNVLSTGKGVVLNGVNSSETGIEINNVRNPIKVLNTAPSSSQVLVDTTSSINSIANFHSVVNSKGIGLKIENKYQIISGDLFDEYVDFIGILGLNSGVNKFGTFIKINNESTIKKFKTGMAIHSCEFGAFVGNNVDVGLNIEATTGIVIRSTKVNNAYYESVNRNAGLIISALRGNVDKTSFGQTIEYDDKVVGLNLVYSSPNNGGIASDLSVVNSGIRITSNDTGRMLYGIDINKTNTAGININLINGIGARIIGSQNTDNIVGLGVNSVLNGYVYEWLNNDTKSAIGFKARGASNWSTIDSQTKAIDIQNFRTGIYINDTRNGITVTRSSLTGFDSGIKVINHFTGYESTNCSTGFKSNNSSLGFMADTDGSFGSIGFKADGGNNNNGIGFRANEYQVEFVSGGNNNNGIGFHANGYQVGFESVVNDIGFKAGAGNNTHLYLVPKNTVMLGTSGGAKDGMITVFNSGDGNIRVLVFIEALNQWTPLAYVADIEDYL